MIKNDSISRRSFMALLGAAPLGLAKPATQRIPIGLELYSVRDELAKDLMGTVRAVAKMGYEVVEFYSPYYDWTPDYAKEVRKLLNDLGIRCLSTHNRAGALGVEGLNKAIELNQILGSKFIVMASAGRVTGLDGWKTVGDTLSRASEKLLPLGMRAGFHNHKLEFVPLDGKRPMEVIAAHTPKEVMLQLDVGTVSMLVPTRSRGSKLILGGSTASTAKTGQQARATGTAYSLEKVTHLGKGFLMPPRRSAAWSST
ncbi:MAG TPA: TIM barrel protein [Terriglobia bacterium]|jgi:hypothetical protein|nr:TIM barrel protein [Terriglobia bacterium]